MQITVLHLAISFVNHLDPSVNKRLWSEEELETLYSKYREYGNKWFLIQKHLPGRCISTYSAPRLKSKTISTAIYATCSNSSSSSSSGIALASSMISRLKLCSIFMSQKKVSSCTFRVRRTHPCQQDHQETAIQGGEGGLRQDYRVKQEIILLVHPVLFIKLQNQASPKCLARGLSFILQPRFSKSAGDVVLAGSPL